MSDARRITSRDNSVFKALRALVADPRRHGRTLLDGVHLVTSCFARGIAVKQLLVSESGQRNAEIVTLLQGAGTVECVVLRDSLFREISGVSTPTGIAAVIDIPPVASGELTGDAVLLDAVQDAGNVGAILRSTAAAGVRDVLLGPGCAGAWTSRVLRAGQGAHFSLAIREQVDLAAVLATCSGISVATVARGGVSLHELDLTGPTLWLVGNEGAGLSAELIAAAKVRATIPLASGTESLNVAAATAVCLFEARRQRATILKTNRPAQGGPERNLKR
ncbi:MAG: RNA methyltransferase [Sulfuritalea sp.]|jgi:TrmH family RNA methyltransferase|nr:RNA methyltransferase [Sulfuritalea sp.]